MTLRPPARRRLAALTATSLLLGTAGALAVAAPAQAATYTVTSTADGGSGSLREAIDLANANPGADTIDFSAALLNATILINSPLIINEALTISGLGSASLTISQTTNGSIFVFLPDAVPDQDFTLSGITIQGDGVLSGSGVFSDDVLQPVGDITITDVSFVDLFLGFNGGAAIFVDGMSGTLRVEDSSVIGTEGGLDGAIRAYGVATAITITGSEFIGNISGTGSGGAISIDSPTANVTITDSQFDDNVATPSGSGGAVFINNAAVVNITGTDFESNIAGTAGGGLAVFNATTLTVSDGFFFDNTSTGNRGGGLIIGNITGLATVSGTTFSTNRANIAGGAVATIDNSDILIQNSTFVDNTTDGDGGAFYTDDTTGTISIERSTFEGNESNGDGGALFLAVVTGSLGIHSSTFFDNSTDGIGDSLAVPSIDGDVTVINSTLDEQLASALTVAVTVEPGGEFRLRYSTVAGQVFVESNEGIAEILSTIIDGLGQPAVEVAFNDPVTVSSSILSSAVSSSITDGGGNQFSVADAKLGPLQDNGGPTLTRMPLAGSPAIDRGFPGGTPPTFDQRFTGFPRVSGGRVDVGSVEVQQVLPATGSSLPGELVAAGGLLLILGAGIVVGARRRPRHP